MATIDIEEFRAREQQRTSEFEAGMAEVRERGTGGGNLVMERSAAQRRENLSLLSAEDLVELVLAPCQTCKQRRLDMFKLSDHPIQKLLWQVVLDDFEEPFVATDEFLEAATEALHDALAATLDAHEYDYSKLRYVISVE